MIFHPCKNLNSLQNLKSYEKISILCKFLKSREKIQIFHKIFQPLQKIQKEFKRNPKKFKEKFKKSKFFATKIQKFQKFSKFFKFFLKIPFFIYSLLGGGALYY